MKRPDIAIGGLWFAALVAAAAAVIYAFVYAPSQFLQFAGALVAAAATILVAILTHAFSALREQTLEQQKQKQKNYTELLSNIGKYIRTPAATRDAFETIHLQSWIVGSPEVILATQNFLATPTAKTLDKLLLAMRSDIGLSGKPGTTTEVLLQPETPTGHLPAQ
jgi:signal transduction histidine kinase